MWSTNAELESQGKYMPAFALLEGRRARKYLSDRFSVSLARQEEEACTVSLRASQRRKEYTVGALTRENRQHADRISELECRLKCVYSCSLYTLFLSS